MNLWKILVKRKLVTAAFVGFGLCLALALHLSIKPSIQTSSAALITKTTSSHKPAKAKQVVINSAFPVRLKIPKIGVDAALDYVSLTSKGELGAPKGPATAGWYARGPRPGETGSSVIDGHFGWVNNTPAVFDNLHKLQAGDSLYVEDDRGATAAFVVSGLKLYGQNQDDSEVFRSNDGRAHLNLITCEGTWNAAQKSYSNRLVVFADKEG